jgi:hypothetical protein
MAPAAFTIDRSRGLAATPPGTSRPMARRTATVSDGRLPHVGRPAFFFAGFNPKVTGRSVFSREFPGYRRTLRFAARFDGLLAGTLRAYLTPRMTHPFNPAPFRPSAAT